MPVSEPLDYYRLDTTLSDEERAVRDAVRAFVERDVRPRIREFVDDGALPREIAATMGGLGLLGPSVRGPGCPCLSPTIYGLICHELERCDSGLRSFASVQGSLVMWPIANFGSEEQRRRWLPELAAGRAIGCFGLTEAGHGSDPGGMETVAVRDGDGWRLRGAKMWITNAVSSDVAVVWARGPERVLGFLVERGAPGFSTQPIRGKWSLRASDTGELVLDDVPVPESSRLPDAVGLRAPLACLNQARYGIAWGAVGAAEDCFGCALDYVRAREQFGRPLSGFQLVQEKLVDMHAGILKGQLLAHRLGRLKDDGLDETPLTSLAKRENVAMALDVARTARSLLGAAGVTDEHPVGRHLANLESVFTYEGTHDIHTLILGADLTDQPAYR